MNQENRHPDTDREFKAFKQAALVNMKEALLGVATVISAAPSKNEQDEIYYSEIPKLQIRVDGICSSVENQLTPGELRGYLNIWVDGLQDNDKNKLILKKLLSEIKTFKELEI
jgi:hypothetical protein